MNTVIGELFVNYTLGEFKTNFENMITKLEKFKEQLEKNLSTIVRCQRNKFSDKFTFENHVDIQEMLSYSNQISGYKWTTLENEEYDQLEQFMYSFKYTQLNQREKTMIDEFFTDMQIINRIKNEIFPFGDLVFKFGYFKKDRSIADLKVEVDTYINICNSILIDYDLAHTSKKYQLIKDVENLKKVLDN